MSAPPYDSNTLAQAPLVVAALSGTTLLADHHFQPGSTVTVGSNSGNDLVIPERFELTSFTLLTNGNTLKVAAPMYLQTSIWHQGEVLAVQGFVRDLRRKHPTLTLALPLASERFLVRYATGIAFLGRFTLEHSKPRTQDPERR